VSARIPGGRREAEDNMGRRSRIRRRLRAREEDSGRSLSDFLGRRCPELPAGFLKKLLRKGFVTLDGVVAGVRDRLRPGQEVALRVPEGSFLVAPNPDVRFDVVYEDDDLVVLEKPAGVVSEPGIGHKLDTVLNGLIARYGEEQDRLGSWCDYGMVHRLDRGTSGLMVAARKAGVQRALARAFRGGEVEKRYVALVAGRLEAERGVIRVGLGRTRRGGRAVAVVGGKAARRAETGYRVLRRFDDATLVEARPRTGRWRQIRLHFRALGHPVAGDEEEGDAAANALFRRKLGLQRMFLHASRLGFAHPRTGRRLRFRSALPPELRRALDAFGS